MAVTTYVSSYSKIESWGDELNRSRDDDETGQVFVFFKNFNLIPNQLNSSHSSAFIKDFEPDQAPHSSSIHPSIQLQYASQTTKTIIIIIILELTPLPHSQHIISIILSFLLPLFIASAAELLTFLIKDSILTIANRLPTQTWIIPNHSHLSNHVFFNQHAQSCWIDCERHPRISNTCSPILLLTLGYRRHSRWSIHIKDVKALRWIKFLLSISYLKISTCSSSPC